MWWQLHCWHFFWLSACYLYRVRFFESATGEIAHVSALAFFSAVDRQCVSFRPLSYRRFTNVSFIVFSDFFHISDLSIFRVCIFPLYYVAEISNVNLKAPSIVLKRKTRRIPYNVTTCPLHLLRHCFLLERAGKQAMIYFIISSVFYSLSLYYGTGRETEIGMENGDKSYFY